MTTSAIIVSTNKQDSPLRPERIYVGIDLGYREHVAAAIPLAAFNPQHRPEGWKRVKTLKFTSDAAGYQRLKRYLDRLSIDSADFLVLLEPTGGYYGLSLILFLLGKGYRVGCAAYFCAQLGLPWWIRPLARTRSELCAKLCRTPQAWGGMALRAQHG